MKILLLILIVVLIMIIANGVAKQYKERHNLYANILKFLNDYELNIGFKKEKILDVVHKFESNNESKKIIEIYKNHLTQKTDINFESITILQEDEQKFIENIFKNLGAGDVDSEKLQLKEMKIQLKAKVEETAKIRDKFCPLIIKLSLLFAIALVILFLLIHVILLL